MANITKALPFINSLFSARQDVFAIHWQKEEKQGYMPAYFYDPYQYQRHKMAGGQGKRIKKSMCFRSLVKGIILKNFSI